MWLQHELPGATFTHTFALRTGEVEWSSTVLSSVMLRVLCHWLVSEIADRGLPEASETLLQLRNFYQGAPQVLHVGPTTTTMAAALGTTRERAPLILSEE